MELTRLGAPMGFLDVGGGLGIDYDGSRIASAASTNYSLQKPTARLNTLKKLVQ